MKKKKIIAIMLVLIVTTLFAWRIWPHSLREIIGANDEPFDEISVNITEFGVDNSSLQMDVYKVAMSPADGTLYDQLLTLIEGTKFRQDLRNLLPWDVNTVSSGRKNITHSANLMLTGAGLDHGCHITYHGNQIVSFSIEADSGFLVYHPTDRTALDLLVSYTKEHGALQD